MSETAKVTPWEELKPGLVAEVPFTVTPADMTVFMGLSDDRSRIHWDAEYARRNGFRGPVVYGAITVARLSNLVGMHLPGDLGLATEWKIDFNTPLYVNEPALIRAEISHVSEATRVVKLRFRVTSGERLIASGTAGSKILEK